jgi:septum formation protein
MGFSSIILASNSPRRRQLLSWTEWPFVSCPIPVDETPLEGEIPSAYVRRLAESKGRAALTTPVCALKDQYVLAADTIVVDDGEMLGKPCSAEDASVMLLRLRGHSHQVLTALAVFAPPDFHITIDLCMTVVPMRSYTEDEIASYVATGDPLDKAGAYAIQNQDFNPVTGLTGCFACVMGLPLCHLVRMMQKTGIEPQVDVPGICQNNLGYTCLVTQKILNGEM